MDALLLELSQAITHVYGATETLLSPAKAGRQLVLHCEAGSFRCRPGDYRPKVFTAANATETFTSVAHGFATGDGPYKVSNSGGGLPSGLSGSTLYWVIRSTADDFFLATSWENAKAGTKVLITTDGTGTQTIAGMPATPGASVTDGYGSFKIAANERLQVCVPDKLTVKGASSSDILTAWWI